MGQGKRSICFALALATLPLAASGCRVNEGDVKRWEQTQRGPYKLVAVITHDKYPLELRTDAAISLIRMPPRGGVRQGIKFLIEKYKDEEGEEREGALNQLSPDVRQQLVDKMVPILIEELKAPPPPRADGRLPPDPTIPFKDASFAMLVHEPPLVSNEETKKQLKGALMKWAQTGFEDRVENGSQQYGLEQMMRALGSESVKTLPGLVSENTARIDRIAGLIKDIGDDQTKLELSKQLVVLAEKYNSQAWIDQQTKIVKEFNAKNAGGQQVSDQQVAAQVDKIQERRLTEEVFPAMKRVAGKPSVEWLIKYASDNAKPASRRKLALAALEGNLDKNNKAELDSLFAIAKNNDVPDEVRDVAFARMDEFPKDQILNKLYSLADTPKWKVRWVAFDHALRTLNVKGLPDFMNRLPKTSAAKFGQAEALGYAQTIRGERVEGDAKTKLDAILPYRDSKDLGPKLVALGYFWGKKDDKKYVQGHQDDREPLPKCDADDKECAWSCDVAKAPGSKETELHEAKTVGDWVKSCMLPNMDK